MLQQNYIRKVTRLCQRGNTNEVKCKLKLKKCRNFYLCVLESLKVFHKDSNKKETRIYRCGNEIYHKKELCIRIFCFVQ